MPPTVTTISLLAQDARFFAVRLCVGCILCGGLHVTRGSKWCCWSKNCNKEIDWLCYSCPNMMYNDRMALFLLKGSFDETN